jgi:flagellar hook-associated protein 2
MSGLSVAGIASGIDSNSIISKMVALETRSITKYQQRIALEEAERITYEDLSSCLQLFKSATESFSGSELFASLSATSSDDSMLTVSAGDDAPRGVHQVKVLQTATAHRIGGGGISDPIGTKIAAGFTKTDFGAGTTLGSIDSGSQEINAAAASSFDYENNVSLSGQYNGSDNVSISVELLSDVTGPNGSVDLRISADGENFQTFNNVNVVGGVISLDSATHFGDNGISVNIDNADATMRDGDSFTFRARGAASIEYTVGGGERKEIGLDSDTTLIELVQKINDDSSLGMRADILNDGSATNPYRLILTSLTEGSSGEIDILSNSSSISLDGVFAESPVAKSLSYTGDATIDGTLASSAGNSTLIFDVMTGGSLSAARMRVSTDGGLTFHDNNGAGFGLTNEGGGDYTLDLDSLTNNQGGALFSTAIDVDLKLTDDGSQFTKNDRVTVDLYDSELQAAQDALINVNGINLVKSSNVVDDVFEGLTLNLQSADPNKTISVNVSEKVGDITATMNTFVEAYNSVMSLVHAQSKFNPDEDSEAPLLMGDPTLRQIQTSLQNYVTGRISVLNGDGPSSLADVGVTTDSKTGQLFFDSSKLSSALNDDPNAVRRLLSRFGDVVDGSNTSFVSSTSSTKAGTYRVNVTQARERAEVTGGAASTINTAERLTLNINEDTQGTGRISSLVVDFTVGMTATQQAQTLQDAFNQRNLDLSATLEDNKLVIRHNQYGDDYRIDITSDRATGDSGFTSITSSDTGVDLKGTINGVTAEAYGNSLVGRDGYSFEGLQVQVTDGFLGEAGQIRLNDGLGSSFSKILDSFVGFGGVIGDKIQSFDSKISRFEEQMSRVTERATRMEERLRQQFVNLEVTLGRLNATGNYLNAQLAALPGVQLSRRN